MENVDGVCQDTRLFVLLLARQIDPIVSVSRHEDESEDDDHYQKEEGGEVLADLSDGVGETPEVRVGVRALRDDGQVADGSVCQVAGRGTLEAVVLAWRGEAGAPVHEAGLQPGLERRNVALVTQPGIASQLHHPQGGARLN